MKPSRIAVLSLGGALLAGGMAAFLIGITHAPTGRSVESTTPMAIAQQVSIVDAGKYLVAAGNCTSCHTRLGGAQFSGGLPIRTPFGTIYSSNITPDMQTGIGQWSAEDFRRAMHDGLGRGGRQLYPAFPYPSFTKLSDEDVDAIYAYMRTLAPVRYSPPVNDFLLRQRWGMVFWNWLSFKPGRFTSDGARSKEWNRGAYLVEGLGHCSACHSPRNLLMAELSNKAYSGGSFMHEVPTGQVRRWSGVNLTSSKAGLAAWSLEDLAAYLKNGVSMRAGTFGPMNDVIVNSLRNLTSADVRAMATYIKALAPESSNNLPDAQQEGAAGAVIYKDRCEHCHLRSGRGGIFNGPPLAGSAVVVADDPASLINVILYGPDAPKEISLGLWETMKPYADVLSDIELAAVANFVRNAWTNRGRAIKPGDVAKQR